MATVWNEGEPVYPVRMVTHNWSNTFMHLVAAVVAESLDSDTYYEVAELLITPRGLKAIITRLESEGRLDMTFWICAFSINQHASICGGFGEAPETGSSAWVAWDRSTCNTVTGKMYPTCNCTEVKYLNNQPDLCELNKFDDVMRVLCSVHEDTFAQVIVVDTAFQVFFRAWCVAEIIEGNNLRIKTSVKIPSEESLNSNYDMLAMLDVQDCESTHIEDREMILAKITDIHVFNLHLQERIFGAAGLFSHWIDGQEQARRIGRIVTRVMIPAEKRPCARFWCIGCLTAKLADSNSEAESVHTESSSSSFSSSSLSGSSLPSGSLPSPSDLQAKPAANRELPALCPTCGDCGV